MYVSVIICTHKLDNYQNLIGAVDSVLFQTYRHKHIIVIVDGNCELYEKVLSHYRGNGIVKTILLEQNMGISEARNAGIRAAAGDIIAFLDDDEIATMDWIDNLVKTYVAFGAIAVGGKVLPIWEGRNPDYLPEELYWLVGVTHNGFSEDKTSEVRNTFGGNISFKKEVFEKIGLFNKDFGFAKTRIPYMQAEEPELALRMKLAFGKGVMYDPRAIVYHKVPSVKLKLGVLFKRAFYQGYSKAMLARYIKSDGSIDIEKKYLKTSLLRNIPRRVKQAYHLAELKKTFMLITTIISVGLGFAYGSIQTEFPINTKNVNSPDANP